MEFLDVYAILSFSDGSDTKLKSHDCTVEELESKFYPIDKSNKDFYEDYIKTILKCFDLSEMKI